MGEITQIIPEYTGVALDKANQTKVVFSAAADAVVAFIETVPPAINTLSEQANSLREEVNASRVAAQLAETNAAIAQAAAGLAATAASATANATLYDVGVVGGYSVGKNVFAATGETYKCIQDQAEGAVQPLTDHSYWAAIGNVMVIKPVGISTSASISPTLTASPFYSLYGYTHQASQWQVSVSSSFTTTVVNATAGAVITYNVTETLTLDQQYYWRCRHQNSNDDWSDWSIAVAFTPARGVAQPVNSSPANTETNILETFDFSASAFSFYNGTDTHASTDWQVSATSDFASILWESLADGSNLESITIPEGELSENTQYYWRCRYTSTAYALSSDWSAATYFFTVASFANIIGIALVTSGGGAGSWQRIDANGDNKATDAAFFNNHTTYGGIAPVSIDSQAMVKIPKFYYKQGVVTAGDQVGKKAWWISSVPCDGFSLFPSFMDDGSEIDQFWYGAYEATNDGGTKAGSVSGATPLVSIDFPTMQARCAARNVGGVDGFSMVNIHQLSAVQLLCLIENGGPDVQSTIGAGNTSSSAAVNTGSSNAVWRGIYELWGNVWCMTDGLQYDTTNQIKIFDQDGNGTYISTGVTGSGTDGWPTAMRDDSGTGFDLDSVFISESVDVTESNGTFSDYFYAPDSGEENICYHGGHWSNSSNAGLFYLNLSSVASNSSTNIGSRLAKV